MTIFGPLLPDDAEGAAESTLRTWLPTYLREVERQLGYGVGDLADPRTWTTRNSFAGWAEETVPLIGIICPGTTGDPVMEGDGTYRSTFAVGVAVVVSARDATSTRSLARAYASAIRGALVQQPSLGGAARATKWMGSRYDDLPTADSRTLGVVRQLFDVEMGELVIARSGPISPDPDPAEWPAVLTHDEVINKEDS